MDVLVQIPELSIPVAGARVTRSRHLGLDPFTTQKVEYFFYFPMAAGKCAHYPVQISKSEKNVASADAFVFNVVEELTNIDKASWDYVSQWGTADEVIDFLKANNLGLLNLERMAWRLQDKAFFDRAVALLRGRHHYDGTVWSYGILHNVLPAARQFMLHQDGFLNACGSYIDTDLVTIDPVARHLYEHLEYSPLVNARAHQLGAKRKIMNPAQHGQHHALMKVLSYRPVLDSSDHLAAAYYQLLQDRVEEGLAHFAQVKAEDLPERMQYDYFTCYVSFYNGDTAGAKALAAKYADHPVDKWRERFAQVKAQLDEIDGEAVAVNDDEDREQKQDALAATEPGFDFEVVEQEVRMTFQNLKEVTVNYYEMDLEFLFSTSPFVTSGGGGRFSMIKPNESARVVLPEGKGEHSFKLPAAFQSKNVLVEVLGGGKKQAHAYYAHELKVIMTENYGRLQVLHAKDDSPLPKAYVKVYAKLKDGSTKFYKDGYTDLRGKFDYTSLNTDEINNVERFAVLVMHDGHGALVKEAAPPTR